MVMMSKKLVVNLLVIAIVMFTAGCGISIGNPDKEVATAIIKGDQSNAPAYPTKAKTVKDAIYESCYTCGSVSFISGGGDPQVVYSTDIPQYEVKGLSENKKKSISSDYSAQLLKELDKVKPETEEVDTLKALRYASMVLENNDVSVKKELLIMDSGLSTTGYLDFTNDLLYAEPQEIVDALNEYKAIPDLEDIEIVWMFLGQTAKPQDELSEWQKDKLETIWNAILTQGGAKSVRFTTDIASDPAPKGYPSVSLVSVQERVIVVETGNHDEPTTKLIGGEEGIVLDGAEFNFLGNKAEFIDYNAANEGLERYAREMIDSPDNKVYIVGTTATGDRDFCKQLSYDRANTVKDILIKQGVEESQLIVMGFGYDDPWHVDDLDANGRQIEEKAKVNRKVLIFDTKSEKAKELY